MIKREEKGKAIYERDDKKVKTHDTKRKRKKRTRMRRKSKSKSRTRRG